MPSKPAAASSSSETKTTGDGSKDRIQHWIHEQISGFLQKWEGSADQNPAFSVVKKLAEAAQELDPGSVSCLSAVAVSLLVTITFERERCISLCTINETAAILFLFYILLSL